MFSMHIARHRMVAGLAGLLCAVVVTAAQADETALTLQAAVEQGLARAPQLEARDADVSAMREEAVRAGRLPDPKLTFGVANYPVTGPGAFDLRSDPMTSRTFGVMQAIPSPTSRRAERALASARVDAAQADRVAATQSVRERIADAWIDLWAVEQRRDLLASLHDEAALAVQIAQARLRGGEGSAVDARAARSEVATLDNRLDALQADRDAAQAGLQRWLGAPPRTLAVAQDFDQLPDGADRLASHLDQQAPLQAWSAREQVAQAALDQARAATHPDWSVGISYGRREPGLSDRVMLEVGVSVPLFTRNRQDRGISAKLAQRDAVQADHEDARRAQREAVARAVASWTGWGRQITRYQQTLLPLARDRAQTALAGYRGGASLQPWLEARREEIELRLNFADALAAHARLWASLAFLLPSQVTP